VKGLKEQASLMKVPVQICRKDDAGKEVVVETVDGPVVAYLASVKELEGEGAGENKKKRLNKKDKKKQEKEKKEKKEKEKQEKKKENEKDKGKDKQGNNKKKDVQTEAAAATPAPGPSPLDSFARVPMFPEGVVPQVYDSLTAAIQTLSPTFMPSNESNLQRLELQQRLDRMLQEDLSTEAQGVTLAVFGRYVVFLLLNVFFGCSRFVFLCSLFFVLCSFSVLSCVLPPLPSSTVPPTILVLPRRTWTCV
jgi:Ca2+-dependent lipid-binding protein